MQLVVTNDPPPPSTVIKPNIIQIQGFVETMGRYFTMPIKTLYNSSSVYIRFINPKGCTVYVYYINGVRYELYPAVPTYVQIQFTNRLGKGNSFVTLGLSVPEKNNNYKNNYWGESLVKAETQSNTV